MANKGGPRIVTDGLEFIVDSVNDEDIKFSVMDLNPTLWLDAGDESTVIRDGSNFVSQWNDNSGNGNHCTQSAMNAKPTYNQNNGSIDFDPSITKRWLSNSTQTNTTVGTIVVVVEFNSFSQFQNVYSDSSSANGVAVMNTDATTNRIVFIINGSNVNGNLSQSKLINQKYLTTITFNSQTNMYIDGVFDSNEVLTPSLGIDGYYIGTWWNNSHGLDGKIYEIIRFPQELTEEERKKVDTYLIKKYHIDNPFISDIKNGIIGEKINGVGFNGESWVFDGVNDYIGFTLPTTTIETLEFWINPTNEINSGFVGNDRIILGLGTANFAGITRGDYLGSSGAIGETIGILHPDNTFTYIRNIISSTWHNIVFSWNGVSYSIYVDGVSKTTYPNLILGHSSKYVINDMFIGATPNKTLFFDGIISSVKIYNRALTKLEIKQNYNAIKSRFI